MTNEFEIGVEEGVDLGLGIADFPMQCYKENSFVIQCCESKQHH